MITYSRLGKCGRLGNQLWQLASTMGIANTLHRSGGFYFWDYRPFFNVPDILFPDDYMRRELVQAHETPLVDHIDPRAREYLQDWHLWSEIEEQVHHWLQPSEFAWERLHREDWFFELDRPILSMHVRLGDNLDQPNLCHPIRPLSYYFEALEIMQDEHPGSVVVFSDNPVWCQEKFKGVWVDHFYEGTPRPKEHLPEYRSAPVLDWIDLQLMSLCDHHILSNSTYAWWGAYLSHDINPILPTPWFGPELQYINEDLMTIPGWRKVRHG